MAIKRRNRKRDLNPDFDKLKAVRTFPSLRQNIAPTASMFIDDISAGIMPWRFGKADTYNVEIIGDDENKQQVIALLQSLARYDRRDLNELTSNAFEEVARNLAWFGRAPYEITHAEDDQSVYLVSWFTPRRLFNLGRVYVQLVPKKDRDYFRKSIVFLRQRDVWMISMPRELGGYRGYRALLTRLSRFGSIGPSFQRNDLEQGKPYPINFDVSEYRRQFEIFVARKTRRWGWNRRDFSMRNWTEFATFYRTITFKWAQAVLREHILAEFNFLLLRLNINAEVRITGIPNSAHVLDLRNQMVKGLVGYAAATNGVLGLELTS